MTASQSPKSLPPKPNLEQYKKQAKNLLKEFEAGEEEAFRRIRRHPRFESSNPTSPIDGRLVTLADAHLVIAREHGFSGWTPFKRTISALNLMDEGWRARKDNRRDDARHTLTEAVALCRQAGVRTELVDALRSLAHIETDQKHWERASALYEEAVAVCRIEEDPLKLAHTVRHLGDVHQYAGELDDAEACYQEALWLYRNHEEPPVLDLANAVRPLAIIKEETNMPEEARKLWEEARDLYKAVGVQEGVDEASERLARLAP
jgi:tetratricopeptide (TPR) repeat protein